MTFHLEKLQRDRESRSYAISVENPSSDAIDSSRAVAVSEEARPLPVVINGLLDQPSTVLVMDQLRKGSFIWSPWSDS
jgi:hypothetical protein